jgi:hypothetical protein
MQGNPPSPERSPEKGCSPWVLPRVHCLAPLLLFVFQMSPKNWLPSVVFCGHACRPLCLGNMLVQLAAGARVILIRSESDRRCEAAGAEATHAQFGLHFCCLLCPRLLVRLLLGGPRGCRIQAVAHATRVVALYKAQSRGGHQTLPKDYELRRQQSGNHYWWGVLLYCRQYASMQPKTAKQNDA